MRLLEICDEHHKTWPKVSCFSYILLLICVLLSHKFILLTAESCSIYVRNLPINITATGLEVEFNKFGPVKQGGIQVRHNKASFITIGGQEAVVKKKKNTRVASGISGHSFERERFRKTTSEDVGIMVVIGLTGEMSMEIGVNLLVEVGVQLGEVTVISEEEAEGEVAVLAD